MGAADARFQHAAAPDRNGSAMGHVVYRDGLTESSHPPHFDVNDFAGAQLQRGLRVTPAVNGFIQTNAGLELFLQAGMKIKIVMPERLLDHQQIEGVKLF